MLWTLLRLLCFVNISNADITLLRLWRYQDAFAEQTSAHLVV
jgi:hypothetical protein